MTEEIYNPEFVKGLFNRMSRSYERMNYITSFGFSIRWRTQFLRSLPASSEQIRIIDLLTGMGETWHAVRQKYPNADFSALDFSDEMLIRAGSKNNKEFEGNIKLLKQDVLNSQLSDNEFDVVICAFGLKTFNPEQLLLLADETKRILKPGEGFRLLKFQNRGTEY